MHRSIAPRDSTIRSPKGVISMTATMTTAALAAELGTTPRELRKFLRSKDSGITPVGKGARYALPGTKPAIASFKKKFAKWDAAREKAKAQAALEKAATLNAEVSEDEDDSDTEPTPDELTDEVEDLEVPEDDD